VPAQPERFFFVSSYCGRIRCFVTPGVIDSFIESKVQYFGDSSGHYVDAEPNVWSVLGYNFRSGYPPINYSIPYFILAIASSASASVLWIGWSARSSLRTLLTATALTAVGLGLVVWLAG